MCNVGDGFPTDREFFHAAGAKGWSTGRSTRAWDWLAKRRDEGRGRIRSAADIIDALDSMPVDLVFSTETNGLAPARDMADATASALQRAALAHGTAMGQANAANNAAIAVATAAGVQMEPMRCHTCHRPLAVDL